MRKYLQLVFLAVSVFCSEILLAESRDPVRILDLRTLNELDLKEHYVLVKQFCLLTI